MTLRSHQGRCLNISDIRRTFAPPLTRVTFGIHRIAQGTTMTIRTNRLEHQVDLRLRAQSSLGRDASPGQVAGGVASALGVLMDMASSPDTAADALAVLHELQVHQVELALQSEELRASLSDLELAMARQVQLYDCAPVAQFTVDEQLLVLEANLTGAQLLATDREALLGMSLGSFLAPPSLDELGQLLSTSRQGQSSGATDLVLTSDVGGPHRVHASVCVDPVVGRYIVVFMDTSER